MCRGKCDRVAKTFPVCGNSELPSGPCRLRREAVAPGTDTEVKLLVLGGHPGGDVPVAEILGGPVVDLRLVDAGRRHAAKHHHHHHLAAVGVVQRVHDVASVAGQRL